MRARLGCTRFHRRDLAERDERAPTLRDDELIELFRVIEPPLETYRALLHRARHLPNRCGEILRAHGIHHLIDTHAERGEIRGPHIDVQLRAVAANHIHLRNASDGTQVAGDARIGKRGELRRGKH